MFLKGNVIRIDGKTCIIHYNDCFYQAYIKRNIKGADPSQYKAITAGDYVLFELRDDDQAVIHELCPRTSWLSRRSVRKNNTQQVVVANIDQLIIVTSIIEPAFHVGIIDRFLIAAQKGNMSATIVVNKVDLKNQENEWPQIQTMMNYYQSIGYDVIYTSIMNQDSLEKLKLKLSGKSTVFAGHSGVGKSSLLKTIEPGLDLATQRLNNKTKRGKHTTTAVTIYPLSFGGFLVDTPGIRELSLWQLEPEIVSHFFKEMQEIAHLCKYNGCSHTHEPLCAVKDAVEKGDIAKFRYESYVRILESLAEEEKNNPKKINKWLQ